MKVVIITARVSDLDQFSMVAMSLAPLRIVAYTNATLYYNSEDFTLNYIYEIFLKYIRPFRCDIIPFFFSIKLIMIYA